MKFRLSQRGIVLAEFAIALPLLILLLGALGIVTLNAFKIAREQVADYVLETETQNVIDRIAADARAAYYVEVKHADGQKLERIIFICHANRVEGNDINFYDIYTQRIYAVHSAAGQPRHIYFKRSNDDNFRNPLTGENSYGNTFVTDFRVDEVKLADKILRVTLEMESVVTQKKIRLSTAVFMPDYGK